MKILTETSENRTIGNYPKSVVMIHKTLGSFNGALSWLCNPASRSSAHFLVGRKGEVAQLSPLKDKAWHAGKVKTPNARALRVLKKNKLGRYVDPNNYMVGIEFVAGYDENYDGEVDDEELELTPEQITVGAALMRKMDEKGVIELKPENIIIHRDIADYKPDMEKARRLIVSRITTMKELKRDVYGGFWFVKQGDHGKQKVDSINGLLTVLSRELGVETMSEEYFNSLKDKKYF